MTRPKHPKPPESPPQIQSLQQPASEWVYFTPDGLSHDNDRPTGRPRPLQGAFSYNHRMATKKKLTKVERQVQEQMLALLEYAVRPDRWYDIGEISEATKRERLELLEKRGVIEIWREINRYRLKPQK